MFTPRNFPQLLYPMQILQSVHVLNLSNELQLLIQLHDLYYGIWWGTATLMNEILERIGFSGEDTLSVRRVRGVRSDKIRPLKVNLDERNLKTELLRRCRVPKDSWGHKHVFISNELGFSRSHSKKVVCRKELKNVKGTVMMLPFTIVKFIEIFSRFILLMPFIHLEDLPPI